MIPVVSAAQSAARDRATIERGVPSRALMQRAGAAAAAEIVRRFPRDVRSGVTIFAGPGNNGGDAWVVAGALAAVGIDVRMIEVAEAKTDDARAERALARQRLGTEPPSGAERLVVDGVLGTGTQGAPRGAAAQAIARIDACRATGARVVALDVPSGLDATTGSADVCVTADLTVTFGAMKRGMLVRRERCGAIVVVDIGLAAEAADTALPMLVDRAWVSARVPAIAADAHKGTRRRIAIAGGSVGMAGASILACRAALRSGVGMVRAIVDERSVPAVQAAVAAALARSWPDSDAAIRDTICDWAHALVIGPGLGRSNETRRRVERMLTLWRGPTVLDADALNVFEGDADALATLLAKRPAVITPHVMEFARVSGASIEQVLAEPFDVGAELAARLGCVVLLKGVPTVITAPDRGSLISATGTPALATAGSGDLLAGIVGTLVAQMDDPLSAAACAAWVHGRAAERATPAGARGVTLDDIVDALADVWSEPPPPPRPPVLLELPAIPPAGSAR